MQLDQSDSLGNFQQLTTERGAVEPWRIATARKHYMLSFARIHLVTVKDQSFVLAQWGINFVPRI